MLGSYHSLWHKFGNLHCGISQQMQLQVFEGSVPQAASFGREVWAPMRLGKAHAQKRTQDYPAFRRLGRVRCTVCEGVLVQELGSRSLEVLGGGKCFTSGNNLVAPPKRSVV